MNHNEFRVIPGYEGYCTNAYGFIKSIERDLYLNQYLLNGYLIVDAFRGAATETLPVHRAVALAWVMNPDPVEFPIVNHKDGVATNNRWDNLEWSNYSNNNYHAVNTGLRPDNIPCRVRDFYTGQVYTFPSMAQAAEFMGMRKDTPIYQLSPKMFGKLIAQRFEFRHANDQRPWFYENRVELVPPSRYMVIVTDQQGVEEVYSNRDLLKDYQLYGSPSKSIPGLAQYGNQIHPEKRFEVRDSFAEVQHEWMRNTKASVKISIRANHPTTSLDFTSLTQCAKHFNVDRSSIQNRLDNGKELDGWTFTSIASPAGNG